jgi:hypothetical protein
MPSLALTNDQVINLVKQLPPDQKDALFAYLLAERWKTWADLASDGSKAAQIVAAERGLQWEAMSDEERVQLIDDLVHEDRSCPT